MGNSAAADEVEVGKVGPAAIVVLRTVVERIGSAEMKVGSDAVGIVAEAEVGVEADIGIADMNCWLLIEEVGSRMIPILSGVESHLANQPDQQLAFPKIFAYFLRQL